MMDVFLLKKGALKTEFLVCNSPCKHECDDNCKNEKKEISLLEHVVFCLPDQQILTIHPGFVFDGASIPQICWTSIGHPLEHRFIYAALLHDALYSSQYLPRKTADQYFQKFLTDFAGVGRYTAWKMYTGVRLFGSHAWNSKTEKQIAAAKQIITLERGTV